MHRLHMLKTLDLSKNQLKTIGSPLGVMTNLKNLNVDENQLEPGALDPVAELEKLQTLSASGNQLGKPKPPNPNNPKQKQSSSLLPTLPASLKQLKLDANGFTSIPPQITAPTLTKLELLSLADNNLTSIPDAICNLIALTELNLDRNGIVSLPSSIGQLSNLKTLSLKDNAIKMGNFADANNRQPLPSSLFTDTQLIDLNLHGNPMTSTLLNKFDGYNSFLERREKVKSKNIYGGALTDLDVCGLK